MARQSSDNLARLRREPNKMNSVLVGLSCSRREAYEFARSDTVTSNSEMTDVYHGRLTATVSKSWSPSAMLSQLVSTCRWNGTGKRCRKLTAFTADAFVVTKKFNIAAATELLTDHNFSSATFFQLSFHRTRWRSSSSKQDSV